MRGRSRRASGVALDGAKVLVTGYDTVENVTIPWVARVDPNTAAIDYLFKGKAGGIATAPKQARPSPRAP